VAAQSTTHRAGWVLLLALVAISVFLAVVLIGPRDARATQCVSASGGCLPGSGYSFDNPYCGATVDPNVPCGDGSLHSYGFNSADYDGGGHTTVCALVEHYPDGGDQFGGCGTDILRSCFQSNCNDVTNSDLYAFVYNLNERHTISGHAKA
jgi:hypothetical protein